jgi:hypothetical protein
MGLGLKRMEDETWLECVIRYAEPFGLAGDVEEAYNTSIRAGMPEDEAAWGAAYDWDICEVTPDEDDDETDSMETQ